MEVIPAIIPKDLPDLTKKLEMVRELVERVHIDFCEDTFALVAPLPFRDQLDCEAHLMISDPLALLPSLVKIGFVRVLVHVESYQSNRTDRTDRSDSFSDLIHEWRGAVEIGAVLKIETPLDALSSFAHEIQSVQLMGIAHIGRQGEPFDERVIARVREARTRYPHLAIAVDGGVSLANARSLVDAGASRLVVGSAIFGSGNPRAAIEKFKRLG